MEPTSIIAVSAVVLSALTFLYTVLRSASTSYVHQLEARVEKLEEQLKLKDIRIEELEEENFRYLRKLVTLGGP